MKIKRTIATEPLDPRAFVAGGELAPETFSIAVELGSGDELPTELMLLANGLTVTTKGPIVCNAAACAAVLATFKAMGRDKLPFDYDHGMVSMFKSDGRAAGWFVPAARDGALMATQIEWTPAGAQALKDREYRYFSPAIFRNSDSGEVTRLVNVAITALPATLNQTPIVSSEKEENMDLAEFLATFGASNAADALAKWKKLEADNGALLAASQAQNAELTTLKAAQADAAVKQEAKDKAELLNALLTSGKLPPALRPWAETQTLAQLTAYGAAAPAIATSATTTVTAPVSGATAQSSGVTLTAEERLICKQLKLSEADYCKTRAELAAAPNPWITTTEDIDLERETASKVRSK